MEKFIFSLLVALISANSFAKSVELLNTEIQHITSKENSINYKLYIGLPEGYYDKENYSYREKYPVLYVLDGDVDFPMVKNIADTMTNFGTTEPIIIVGIGYKGQELSSKNSKTFWKKYMFNRTRDYVPSELTKDIDLFMKERVDGYQFLPNHWQGEKFKSFIEKELIEFINKKYRTSNQNALLGHSLGGLFTTYMMLNSNNFDKYLILSPVIKIDSVLKDLNKHKFKENTEAYFTVGSLEFDEKGSMVKDLQTFYSKLPKEKIKSKMKIIKNEDHISIVPIGVTKGLRFLFKN
jgi:predicted alpha/beta superfamily hydrolase